MQGGFAFADSGGTQFLALDSLADPSTIRGAICSGDVAVAARYDHRATPQSRDNGRQVAANFANQQGDVFRVTGSKASSCSVTARCGSKTFPPFVTPTTRVRGAWMTKACSRPPASMSYSSLSWPMAL